MKCIRWVLLKIQSGHDSVHRRTDGRPKWNQYEAGGIKKLATMRSKTQGSISLFWYGDFYHKDKMLMRTVDDIFILNCPPHVQIWAHVTDGLWTLDTRVKRGLWPAVFPDEIHPTWLPAWISNYLIGPWGSSIKFYFRFVILKWILVIDSWGISCEIALIWMSLDLNDGKSTLVQVMAWCHQVTSHYLSQCWPRSLLPYGVTRPQWVKSIIMSGMKLLIHLQTSTV